MFEAAIVPLFSFKCIKCGIFQPNENFRANKLNKRGYHGTCKSCEKLKRVERLEKADRLRNEASIRGDTKPCKICKQTKEIIHFSRCSDSTDGIRHDCIQCSSARTKKWGEGINRKKRLAVYRRQRLKKKYGLTEASFQAMMRAQKNRCAICFIEMAEVKGARSAAVDHNHTTGVIRSILCVGCNTGIGFFYEDPKVMRAAADYIEKHAKKKR